MESFLEKDSKNPPLLIYFPVSFIDILTVLTESIFNFLRTLPFSLRSRTEDLDAAVTKLVSSALVLFLCLFVSLTIPIQSKPVYLYFMEAGKFCSVLYHVLLLLRITLKNKSLV